MNITDIDDKIIISARQKHLFEQFKANEATNDGIVSESLISKASDAWIFFVKKRFGDCGISTLDANEWKRFAVSQSSIEDAKTQMYLKTATASLKAIEAAKQQSGNAEGFFDACKDVIALWLDNKMGATVTDQRVFRDFAAFWENEYFEDMDLLNIKRPDVLTRVSEYVPEIVMFVRRIMENGFAYELDGSVYFDTMKFNNTDGHVYAKLEPWSADNVKLLQEGEGDLCTETKSKRSNADFALWKNSKPGEPYWDSPWGQGRPGWHIECSAMAGDVLGSNIDIHSGGIDLSFPHHDNELAQSEGCFDCKQWINYFLHAGHLHIEGHKMSKSLKNFISIKEALAEYTAAQFRIMFLLHNWNSTLDYSKSSMAEACSFESTINNFLSLVKALADEEKYNPPAFTGIHNYSDEEKALMATLVAKQASVHAALCDSFNTPQVMLEIRQLVTSANQYYQAKCKSKARSNALLLAKIGKYITKLMRVFGVYSDLNPEYGSGYAAADGVQGSDAVLPYLRVLSSFRDQIRILAQSKADHGEFLKLCDKLRDEDMIELGVSLEDKEGMAIEYFEGNTCVFLTS